MFHKFWNFGNLPWNFGKHKHKSGCPIIHLTIAIHSLMINICVNVHIVKNNTNIIEMK